MTWTPPTDDDLNALQTASENLVRAADAVAGEAARIGLVHNRLAVPVEPPPPDLALPPVGVGGSGAFAGLTVTKRREYLALAKACGLTHFRFTVSWSACEQVKGKYTIAGVVQIAKDIVAAGLIPQALVGWTPPAYRPTGTKAGANAAPDVSKGALLGWESFLRVLLPALYDAGVRRVEVWNEPNFAFMQPVSPGLWVDLVATVHAVACDISRHFVLVAGGVCPAVDEPPRSMGASIFYDAVLDYEPDFFKFVDEVGIHPYAGNHTKLLDGQFWKKHVTYLQTLIPAEVPICGTEHGWKSGQNTEDERVALYTDSVLSIPDKRAPLFLFSLFDFTELYGLLTADGTPKPVYDALQELLVP